MSALFSGNHDENHNLQDAYNKVLVEEKQAQLKEQEYFKAYNLVLEEIKGYDASIQKIIKSFFKENDSLLCEEKVKQIIESKKIEKINEFFEDLKK